jgi:hypothetical protein
VSKDYNYEIGYPTLLEDFKRHQKETPKGVSMTRKGQIISLQFKVGKKPRSQYGCNCSFTLDGMVDALKKAKKVAEALKAFTSEVEFWEWYNKEIKEEGKIENDLITFAEAIKRVEDDFWSRPSRTRRKRDKNNPSDMRSYNRTYGHFFRLLPKDKTVNLADIMSTINTKKRGTRQYGYIVGAMRKLARLCKREDILKGLESIDAEQTEFQELQTVELEEFLEWRDKVLGITSSLHFNADIEARKRWLWVFSTQIVYGLRLSETFAIQNLDKPFIAKDGSLVPALSDPENIHNLIYIGAETNLGTKVKTGSRLARPFVPPKYPNLIELLDIKNPKLPTNKPRSNRPETVAGFYAAEARKRLIKWNAPFTQTHADRHLANINGMQAGIPLEVRAQSLGHTSTMNDSVYKKRQATKTTIDLLLNSNTNAIDKNKKGCYTLT